jgi:HAD superfamily hydrolase (TIGR01450 family)
VKIDLTRKKLFLFDLDGVFVRGKENPIKIGGTRIIRRIRETGRRLFILTNNSTDTVSTIQSTLVNLDIPVRADEILTSGLLTAEYVFSTYGRAKYFLIGERGLDVVLRRAHLTRTLGTHADVVIVGLDRRLTYSKLDRAARVVNNGADIVASHSARLYMYRYGPAIAVGPTVKALEYATGKRATVVGKPSPLMFEIALKKAGCDKNDAVMIGDQVETDIVGAKKAGLDSILVLTGVDKGKGRTGAMSTIRNIDDLADYI